MEEYNFSSYIGELTPILWQGDETWISINMQNEAMLPHMQDIKNLINLINSIILLCGVLNLIKVTLLSEEKSKLRVYLNGLSE